MKETLQFTNLVNRVTASVQSIPQRAATLAVNFSKDRFRSQNWVDTTTQPWKNRKPMRWGRRERPGRAILVDSGRLRRSIRKILVSAEVVIIGTDAPYARVHNEGFRGKVTQRVASHKRNLTKFGVIRGKENKRSTRVEFGRVKRGETTVKTYTRTIRLHIPKRQFIGTSAILDAQLQRMMTAEITRAIRGT